MNGSDWMTQFIWHLIHISHLQWLFRNFTLHHHIKGYLRKHDEAAIQQEVVNLLDTSPQSTPRESRYLLEIQYQPTTLPSLELSSYWVIAMRPAKQAVHRRNRAVLHREQEPVAKKVDKACGGDIESSWRVWENPYVEEHSEKNSQQNNQWQQKLDKQAGLTRTYPKCQHRWLIQAINNCRDGNISFWNNTVTLLRNRIQRELRCWWPLAAKDRKVVNRWEMGGCGISGRAVER